jgi:hypothetical protein
MHPHQQHQQLVIITLSVFPLRTLLATMVHQPSGLTLTYHKWKSINHFLTKTLHLQAHVHHPTQMQLDSSLMIQIPHINAFVPRTLTTGSPTVVQQVITLLYSVIFGMSNLVMSLSSLLTEQQRYPLSKAQHTATSQPQKVKSQQLVLLILITLRA